MFEPSELIELKEQNDKKKCYCQLLGLRRQNTEQNGADY